MIYNPETEFAEEDFIQTTSGNIISRSTLIYKPQAVEIPNGRCIIQRDVIIRGDFAAVQLNKYCFIDEEAILRPCYTNFKGVFRFIPLTIGSHTYIGKESIIESATIGMSLYS